MVDDNKDERSEIQEVATPSEPKVYPFPKYVMFILGNEFCERYSFYGLRSILVLYLTYFIGFDDNTSTVIYHGFTVLAYLFPLVGGAIADGYWGKFNTIFRISILYAVGMVINSLASIPFGDYKEGEFRTYNAIICIIALLIIAFGTGGIKPCVSSFGGDQFEADDVANTATFFDLFYWSINAGSLLSTFLSPILRQTTCGSLGTETSCYFLAFSTPAILMVIAILFFVFGNRYYKKVPPSGQNVFWEVCKCIWYGAFKDIPKDSPNQDHWLYGAYGKVDSWLIRDCIYVVRVLVMFLPLPIYRAAFDQQGSRWTLQAVRMNGYVGGIHILPDQAQICNAFFILAFIPTFNFIYRLVDKCFGQGFVTKLRKMGLGMIFAALAFATSALVQSKIDVNLTVSPSLDSEIGFSLLNLVPETTIEGYLVPKSQKAIKKFPMELENKFMANSFNKSYVPISDAKSGKDTKATGEFLLVTDEEYEIKITAPKEFSHPLEMNNGRTVWNFAYFPGDKIVEYPGWASKDADGNAHLIVISTSQHSMNVSFTPTDDCSTCSSKIVQINLNPCIFGDDISERVISANDEDKDQTLLCVAGYVKDNDRPVNLKKGTYNVLIIDNVSGAQKMIENQEFGTGASYTVIIEDEIGSEQNSLLKVLQDINTNDISMLLIIPQFLIITVAEVMINVTGLEFAYTQAPKSLKSVLTSFWLLTASIGNMITIVVAESKFLPTQVGEYLLFAGLILGADAVFILLSMFYYTYVKPGEFDDFTYPDHENEALEIEEDKEK